jgi:carbonic anhydrase
MMTKQASPDRSNRRKVLRMAAAGLTGLAGGTLLPALSRPGAAFRQGLFGPALASGGAAPWSYGGKDGPAHWGQLAPSYRACSQGRRQSPIDLAAAHLSEAVELGLDWHPGRARLSNTGHTLQLDPESDGTPSRLKISGREFAFLQLHFHHPSEHALGGKRWPLEAHFVHKAMKGDDLLVLAVLFRPGRANDLLGRLLARMPAKPGVVKLDGIVDLTQLLPRGAASYRYAGSLTTPPCSETVDWVVFRDPIEAGVGQIGRFAQVFPMNARPLQPLDGRSVTVDLF